MFGSHYHSLAKWLADLFEPVRKSICIDPLHDTLEIINYIKGVNKNYKHIISFDVESLFPDFPITETINFV